MIIERYLATDVSMTPRPTKHCYLCTTPTVTDECYLAILSLPQAVFECVNRNNNSFNADTVATDLQVGARPPRSSTRSSTPITSLASRRPAYRKGW